MKLAKCCLFIGLFFVGYTLWAQDLCETDGNIAIFTNYDGGYLNIDINEDIPDLKIGIASYEPTAVSFFGMYVDNITEIHYAGYEPTEPGNYHCDDALGFASVNAPEGIPVTILNYPSVTLSSTFGNNNGISGADNCINDAPTGGNNTAEQVVDYFLNVFSGSSLLFIKTQYSCYCTPMDLSVPATCCQENALPVGDGIFLGEIELCETTTTIDGTYPGALSYLWSNGATSPSITVNSEGPYDVTVTLDCGVIVNSANVISCQPPPCDSGIFSIDLVDFLDLCDGANPTINIISEEAESYLWQDGSTEPSYTILSPGVYSVTVTDGLGCTASDDMTVNYSSPPVVDLGGAISLCQGETTTLDATTPDGANYTWQDGSNDATLLVEVAGTYTVTVSSAIGCTASSSVVVNYNAPLSVGIGSTNLCEDDTLTIELAGLGTDFLWQDGSTAESYEILNGGDYLLTVTDDNSCTTSTSFTITTISCPEEPIDTTTIPEPPLPPIDTTDVVIDNTLRTAVPNAFSPNDDGVNDIFRVITNQNIDNYQLLIYNRWGQEVFASSIVNDGWDGTYKAERSSVGQYVYYITYTNTDTEELVELKGLLILIR